ncbi:hypothetical protein [Proteiniclasticum sp. QWL-01]|uniref:hypothetical protein n=1 Tax=Proteiniclasticum sp. QWL-01 TaxID=3036945 RepID=UPI0024102DC1|nr:hypothetical protein [Proteiniclasticum sp. QWL-01]WFF72498.1 hypothetical protein P6M73_14640 [Proteiniclasticum sp. QWL-01]
MERMITRDRTWFFLAFILSLNEIKTRKKQFITFCNISKRNTAPLMDSDYILVESNSQQESNPKRKPDGFQLLDLRCPMNPKEIINQTSRIKTKLRE